MTPWQADLLNLLSAQHSEDDIFAAVQRATRNLGFDYAAYGIRPPRLPTPKSSRAMITLKTGGRVIAKPTTCKVTRS
jgi:hypothetical protein